MDRRGRCMDNIYIERLWRSLKQEAVYVEEINDGFRARRLISNWMTFYNNERSHSSLEHKTPKEAYWVGRDQKLAALKPTRIHLGSAAVLSIKPGPIQDAFAGEEGTAKIRTSALQEAAILPSGM